MEAQSWPLTVAELWLLRRNCGWPPPPEQDRTEPVFGLISRAAESVLLNDS